VKSHLKAHTRNDRGEWHWLFDHLRDTSEAASGFGEGFGGASVCALLGWTHDLGKANLGFQDYLKACDRGEKLARGPGHSDPGAVAAQAQLGDLVGIVLGHHGGLPNTNQVRSRLSAPDLDLEAVAAAKKLAAGLDLPKFDLPGYFRKDKRAAEMFLRMCLSALADADFLNTEEHFGIKPRGDYPCLPTYLSLLEEKLSRYKDDDRSVTQVRRSVQEQCRLKGGQQRNGFYRLTVPTGGGKTLASLLFGLHNSGNTRKRIIVAIPYTSIIQQTAEVYGEIFGVENLLEHHSAFDSDDDETAVQERRRLAAENWDCPLVVTTTVQLFDSLFARKPGKVRKLHRLANSVIVLDEAQTLPADLLQPYLEVLTWLVEHANTTVVFCTATQPDYENVPNIPAALKNAEEITDNPHDHFRNLKRVEFKDIGLKTPKDLAELIVEEAQSLTILNSRRDSLAVFDAVDDPSKLYLSTLLCGAHRREILDKVKWRLENSEPCHLVSTQVVEAGCDLDFPCVLRAKGPLSSIVQAAGRCNRNGRSELGFCGIFELDAGSMPPGEYRVAAAIAEAFFSDDLTQIETPEVQSRYFRSLLSGATLSTDRKIGTNDSVQTARTRLDFPEVEKHARLITEETETVVIEARAPSELLEAYAPSRALFRKLAPYTVSLLKKEVQKYRKEGLIADQRLGFFLWIGNYDEKVGIARGIQCDPSDLMC